MLMDVPQQLQALGRENAHRAGASNRASLRWAGVVHLLRDTTPVIRSHAG
jgi:hypothetical protein